MLLKPSTLNPDLMACAVNLGLVKVETDAASGQRVYKVVAEFEVVVDQLTGRASLQRVRD